MAGKLFNQFKLLAAANEKDTHDGLRDRELEITRFIAQGLSNREIGTKLFLSEKTIKDYITSIFKKLQMNDGTQVAAYALQEGLTSKEVVAHLPRLFGNLLVTSLTPFRMERNRC
jgi:two-component system response regulator DegU